jgi:hypothetical protein
MQRTKKWHYTVSNTSKTYCYPVGACAHDCPGHDTPQEAYQHYVDGICAGEIRERDDLNTQNKCVECGEWTNHFAILWEDNFHRDIPVCKTHDVRAALTKERKERDIKERAL